MSHLDVTQNLSFLDGAAGRPHQQQGGAPSAKRRRVESGWGVLRAAATSQSNPYMAIPW